MLKISIITTCFNSGDTIRDTIKSVLSQRYSNWEHIIVDGGSTDHTIDIIKSYEPYYNKGNLKWISEPDRGIYDAMNKGLAMAEGDVVGFLNSDDFYSSYFILEEVDKALSTARELDAVYGDIHFVKNSDLNKSVRYYSSKIFHRRLMTFGFQPAHPSFYCRKSVYDKYGGFDVSMKIASDFENLFRFIYVNRIKTRYLNLDFVTMRMGGTSTSGFKSHRIIINDHRKCYRKHGVTFCTYLEFLRYPFKLFGYLNNHHAGISLNSDIANS